MGQYHTIYNKTKNEYFSIGGAKLLEKSYNPLCSTALMVLLCNSNGRGGGDLYVDREYDENYKPKPLKGKKAAIQSALDEVQGRWSGDQIVIQGDYAEKGDPSYISKKKLNSANNITSILLVALGADEDLDKRAQTEFAFLKRMSRI